MLVKKIIGALLVAIIISISSCYPRKSKIDLRVKDPIYNHLFQKALSYIDSSEYKMKNKHTILGILVYQIDSCIFFINQSQPQLYP